MPRKNRHKQRHQRKPKTQVERENREHQHEIKLRTKGVVPGIDSDPDKPLAGPLEIRDRSGKVHRIIGDAGGRNGGSKPRTSRDGVKPHVKPDYSFDRHDRKKSIGEKLLTPDHPTLRTKNRPEKRGGKFSTGDFNQPPKKIRPDFREKNTEQFKGKSSEKFKEKFSVIRSSAQTSNELPQKKFRDSASGSHATRSSISGAGRERFKRPGKSFSGNLGEELKLKARVDKNRKGFGFLAFEDRKREDAFIPPREADQLFHGDRVLATLDGRGRVVSIEVIEHRFRELVGRYQPHPNVKRGGYVVYERKRAREEVYVKTPPPNVKPEDWVKAKLIFDDSGFVTVTAEITDIYGTELPASADLPMVAAEYNLTEEHPEQAEAEARSFSLNIDHELKQPGRIDMRSTPFITIDGETARDFDDAVYVERDKKGYILWVAIADVSHYVRAGTALDDSARSRGTSVYFPERAFHMLPRALSENLCSLRPNEPRMAMVAKISCGNDGAPRDTEIFEALIESKRRATYNEIEDEYQKHQSNPHWEFAVHFELYRKMRTNRSNRGSIDFDLPEAELKVEPNGVPISITNRPRLDAHRLIEEFMIAANEAVTVWALARQWPFIYRVHDEPSEQSLEKFQRLAETMGVSFVITPENLHQTLRDLVARLEGHPAQTLLNTALLRSMKQAIYSSTHGGHFGLASTGYTHFTSPIRRYPDLIVHRMLRHALRVEKKQEKPPTREALAEIERDLEDAAEHCSYRERIATDAERESIRLKQVRFMIPQVGNDFEGKVIGMIESGFFVQLKDPYVEGMVAKDTLDDDAYEFDTDRMVFIGRRTKRQFNIGDVVTIKVIKASIDTRTVDFQLLTHTPAHPTTRVSSPTRAASHKKVAPLARKTRSKPLGPKKKPGNKKDRFRK